MTNIKNKVNQMKAQMENLKSEEKVNTPESVETASKPQHVPTRKLKISSVSNSEWYKEFEGISKDFSVKSGTTSVFEIHGGESKVDEIAVYPPSEKQVEFGVVANVAITLAGGLVILKGIQVIEYEDLNLGLRLPSRESNGKYYDHYEVASIIKAQVLVLVDSLLE